MCMKRQFKDLNNLPCRSVSAFDWPVTCSVMFLVCVKLMSWEKNHK